MCDKETKYYKRMISQNSVDIKWIRIDAEESARALVEVTERMDYQEMSGCISDSRAGASQHRN